MTKNLVSVVVPVFNAGKFLRETLDSLCGQVYGEFEILCIDDGSTDDSKSIIKHFEAMDQRVKYVPQANAGPGAARNHGIELAKGEYIAFQDADDLLHPKALGILVETASRYQADVAICGFQSCREDLSDADLKLNLYVEPEVLNRDLALAFQDSKKFRGHPWGKLYRRSIIGDIRFNALRSGEDTYFNIDIAAHAKCMVVVDIPLYVYRQTSCSLTHQARHHQETIEAGRAIGLHCMELYKQNSISCEAMLALVRKYATNAICLHLLLMIDNTTVSNEQKKELLFLACDAIEQMSQKMPIPSNVFASKYYWVYLMAVKPRSILMLRIISFFRKIIIKFLRAF